MPILDLNWNTDCVNVDHSNSNHLFVFNLIAEFQE